MVGGQEFRHRAPVAFGHTGVLTPGIGAFFDGYGLVKPLPQCPVVNLFLARQIQVEPVYVKDPGAAVGIQQKILVRAVIDEKRLVGATVAEVSAQ